MSFPPSDGLRTGRSLLLLVALAFAVVASPAGAEEMRATSIRDAGTIGDNVWSGDVIAVFFASWSPRCRDVVERSNALERAWGDQARVLLISFQEEESAVRSFLLGKEPRADVLLDGDGSLAKKHGITTLPSMLVLRSGSVAFRGRLPAEPGSVLRSVFD